MIDHDAMPVASLEHQAGFRFRARFDGPRAHDLITDEPPPLGAGVGPNPTTLLATAIADCLASSLIHCLGKARLPVAHLEAEAWVDTARNEQGRLRIQAVRVRLCPDVSPDVRQRMARCLEIFESFCTVTESVRNGIDVHVEVEPHVTPGLVSSRPETGGCDGAECSCEGSEVQEPCA